MADAPTVKNIEDLTARLISPTDAVKLIPLAGPSDGSPTSVFFEVWEPGGAQPDNSHPDSVEIFIVLSGEAEATSDEHTTLCGRAMSSSSPRDRCTRSAIPLRQNDFIR